MFEKARYFSGNPHGRWALGEALPWAGLGDCSRMVREMRFFAGSTERTVTSTMSPTERTSEG